ncbi:hypothetical protein PJP07_31210, partial [Mycobacterium kansasii]
MEEARWDRVAMWAKLEGLRSHLSISKAERTKVEAKSTRMEVKLGGMAVRSVKVTTKLVEVE